MTLRIAVESDRAAEAAARVGDGGCLRLQWEGEGRNAVRDLSTLPHGGPVTAEASDLLDIASAVYLADVNAPRGRNEDWTRDIELEIPVSEPELWAGLQPELCRLLHVLTRDNFQVHFLPRVAREAACDEVTVQGPAEADCVSLLSGGIDSLAGAVMLLRAGRRPRFITHRSGNPTAEAAQRHVLEVLGRLGWQPEGGGRRPLSLTPAGVRIMPQPLPETPTVREPTRRARSLLFMSLAAAAAQADGVRDIYMSENGFFSIGLPLTAARVGSLSTRSTHPIALHIFGGICTRLGLPGEVQNPFLYLTKAEIIRDVLRPVLSPREIQGTVSCWAVGRTHRQCGGCVPCILRRVAMLRAGLHDEAYEMDLLGEPERYRGTDAYINLVDILTQTSTIMTRTDVELLLRFPQLLDLQAASVDVLDALAVLRRHAKEVVDVTEEFFPAAAALMG